MKPIAPLISVIIPVFNRSWQLRRALQSLKLQTFRDFEVIVCNDGSTESIASVVIEFDRELNIRLLQMVNWGGPAKPRNEGLKVAKGLWVAYLDSDDWWDENRLDIVVGHLNDRVDFIYHRLRVARESNSIKKREKRATIGDSILGDPFRQMMLFGNPIPTSATMVRRDILLEFQGMSEERTLISLEDFDCWMRLARAGKNFYFLDLCLGNYWVGGDAISTISFKAIDAQHLLFLRNAPKTNSLFSKQALARQNYVLGLMNYRLGNLGPAFEYLKLAYPLICFQLKAKRWILIIHVALKIIRNHMNQYGAGTC